MNQIIKLMVGTSALALWLVWGNPGEVQAATLLSNIGEANDKGTGVFRSNIWKAYKFTAGSGGTIDSVTLNLDEAAGNYTGFSTYTGGVIRFFNDSSGSVGSQISGTLGYTSTNVGTGHTVYANASGTITLPGAGDYWIGLTCASCANIDYEETGSTNYSGGTDWQTVVDSTSVSTSNNDGSSWGAPYSTATYGTVMLTIAGTAIANTAPTISVPTSVAQATDGTGQVSFVTTLTDADDDTSVLKIEYSDDDGSTWYDPDLVSVSGDGSPTVDDSEAYQIEAITSASDGNTLTVIWDTLSADNSNGSLDGTEQADIKIRVTPNDGTVDGTAQTSAAVTVDNLGPSKSSFSPADGASEVAVDGGLIITFDEAVDVESGNVMVKKGADDTVVEIIDVTSDQVTGTGTTEITINLGQDLASETAYYVQIDATAFDDSKGNSFAAIDDATTWNFTTTDADNPTVTAYVPADNAIDVEIDTNLQLTFSEAVDVESGNIMIKRGGDGSTVETIDVTSARVTGDGTTIIIVDPAINFEEGVSYYVQIDATAFDDAAGNSYAGISDTTSWNLTTVAAPSAVAVQSNDGSGGTFLDAVENGAEIELKPIVKANGNGERGVEQEGDSVVEMADSGGGQTEIQTKIPDPDQVKEVYVRVFGRKIVLSDVDGDFSFNTIVELPDKVGRYPYTVTADYGIFTLSRKAQLVVTKPGKSMAELASAVGKLFTKVHQRTAKTEEWEYWTDRVLAEDKEKMDALYGAMQWQKIYGGIYSNRLSGTVRAVGGI